MDKSKGSRNDRLMFRGMAETYLVQRGAINLGSHGTRKRIRRLIPELRQEKTDAANKENAKFTAERRKIEESERKLRDERERTTSFMRRRGSFGGAGW